MTVAEKKKILFIINPKSGIQNKKKLSRLVEKKIDHDRYDVYIKRTAYSGHAAELAASAVKEGYDVVVAAGGDGTVNEVASSLVHSNTALGVIPCGSGNGFARHLGIPVDMAKSIEFINEAEPLDIDYGTLNGVPFFCACGVGFDALVSNDFAKEKHRGLATYVQKTLEDWVNYKPEVYEVTADSVKKKYKAFLIACGNASQYGNNAYITPYASMRDGLLSVSVMEPFTAVEVPFIVTQLFSNSIYKNSRVTTFSTHKLTIKRKYDGPVHYDGEPAIMDAVLDIEVVPGGLKVLAKPGWDGTCEPMPLYKQFFDTINENIVVPELHILKLK